MTSTENIYGNPFSYLTSTGANKPLRASFRTSEREEPTGENPETKTPFSYLSPAGDPPRISSGSGGEPNSPRELGDGEDPGEVFVSDRNISKRSANVDLESAYDPPPPNHYASMQRLAQKDSGYPGYQGQSNPGYQSMEPPPAEHAYTELGKLPEANDHGRAMYYSGEHSKDVAPQSSNVNQPTSPEMRAKPVRPSSRDSALGASYRSNSQRSYMDKKGKHVSCCFLIVSIFITALVCLGIGFAVGWFVKDVVVPTQVAGACVAITTTTTTQLQTPTPAPVPKSSTTTSSTTTTTTTTPATTTTQSTMATESTTQPAPDVTTQ